MSGMMFTRATRLKVREFTKSAVPSQLLETTSTSLVFGRFFVAAVAGTAQSAASTQAAKSASTFESDIRGAIVTRRVAGCVRWLIRLLTASEAAHRVEP